MEWLCFFVELGLISGFTEVFFGKEEELAHGVGDFGGLY